MSAGLPRGLQVLTAVGAGLVAGVFFAFSTFVMQALGRLAPPQGLAAMQAINKAAPTPLFMTALFGTGLLCVAVAISAATRLDETPARLQLAGSLLFLISIVLTIVYHVPRNDALALLDPADPAAAELWQRYLTTWTAANHVRTVASLAGAIALTLGLHG